MLVNVIKPGSLNARSHPDITVVELTLSPHEARTILYALHFSDHSIEYRDKVGSDHNQTTFELLNELNKHKGEFNEH